MIDCNRVYTSLLAVLVGLCFGGRSTPAQAYEYQVPVVAHYLYYTSNTLDAWVWKAGYYKATHWCAVSASTTTATCAAQALQAQYDAELAEFNKMGSTLAASIGFSKPIWSRFSVGAYLPVADVSSGAATPPSPMAVLINAGIGGVGPDLSGLQFMFGTTQYQTIIEKETQISTTAAARKNAVAYSSAADSAGSAAPCQGGTQWFGTWSGCQPGMTIPARNVVRTLDDGDRPVQITPTIPSLPTR